MKLTTLFLFLGLLIADILSAQPEVNQYFDTEPAIDCATGEGLAHFQVYLNFADSLGPDSAHVTVHRSTYAWKHYTLTANMDVTEIIPPGHYVTNLLAFYADGSFQEFQTPEMSTNFCVPFAASLDQLSDTDCTDDIVPMKVSVQTDEGLPMLVYLYRDGELVFDQERNTPLDTSIDATAGQYMILVKKIHGLDTAYATSTTLIEPCLLSTGISEDATLSVPVFPNPASDMLFVKGIPSFEICDMTGRMIEGHRTVGSIEEISLSGYEPGKYFVRSADQRVIPFIVLR